MAKKSKVEWWTDYDSTGRWCVRIRKDKGRLTLDEVRTALRECEWDFYLLFLDCYHDENDEQMSGLIGMDEDPGDYLTAYRTDALSQEKGDGGL